MIIGKDIHDMLSELERLSDEKSKVTRADYQENRNFRRSRVVWEAKLKAYFNDITLKGEVREVSGVVRDISANGAKVHLTETFPEHSNLELQIPKLGVFPCHIVWEDGRRVGIQFSESPEQIFAQLTKVLPNA
ncbi:MAG: PilZ domain-containing protein [Sneathiella sp.]